MGGYIQTEVEPEAIIETMNEDGGFAAELWFELAEKLHMGLLLDNACDLFSNDLEKARYIADQMEFFATMLRSRHDELEVDDPFDVIWAKLAEEGKCDGIYGAEYKRVKSSWSQDQAIRLFIIREANLPPQPVNPTPDGTGVITWNERVTDATEEAGRDLTLDELLHLAKSHVMTPAEIEAQRVSWSKQDMD